MLFLLYLQSGIGIYGGLYQVPSLMQTFIFIRGMYFLSSSYLISMFLSIKFCRYNNISDLLEEKIKIIDNVYRNQIYIKISNLLEEEIKIILSI